jgi:predicted TIM-barrel fold metal-dependent hydrolase
MPGIRCVALTAWPAGKAYTSEEDDLFWSEAVRLRVPVCAHGSFGGGLDAEVAVSTLPLGATPINKLMTRVSNGFVATQMITSGLLDRFPDLVFYFAETGIGWLPFYAEQADDNYRRHRFWAGLELAHEPSWYIVRHFRWSFQWDLAGVAARDRIGIGNMMWASDFPHVATDWPNSADLISRQFGHLSADERRAIVSDNVCSFLHLDEA